MPPENVMQIKQISGAGGAEITGIDLSTADIDTVAKIKLALAKYLVVTFPDQHLDDPELALLTSKLGQFGLEPFI